MSWDTDNHTKPDSKYIQMNNKWAAEKAVSVYAAQEWLLWGSLGKKSISRVIVHGLGLQRVLQGLDRERKECISSSWKKKTHKCVVRELPEIFNRKTDLHFNMLLKNFKISFFSVNTYTRGMATVIEIIITWVQFKQRHSEGGGVSPADIWRKGVSGSEMGRPQP